MTAPRGLKAKALEALRAAGPKGLTTDEAAELIGTTPGAIRPRFTELSGDGLIDQTRMKRLNISKKMATVWVAK